MTSAVSHRLAAFPLVLRLALGAAVAVLSAMVVARIGTHHSFGYFTRDPAQITGAHEYLGFVSFFGLFGWCAGAVSLAFGAFSAHLRGETAVRNVLTVGAAALTYLMLDDALLLHDSLYERVGISNKVSEPIYVVVVIVLLVRGWWFVKRTHWPILVLAGCLFAVSIGADLATDDLRYVVVEDGAKFLAIATLAAYCATTAAGEMTALADVGVLRRG